ncbi:MAG TPA: aldehyde dehydrogenase family protein [bacterium]|jgi:acyl-CoA reductase-like NAD-dependent aldehyde dehydrogenase
MADLFPLVVPGAATRGKPLEVHAPYDGHLIATCETADWAAADKALSTAEALYRHRDQWLPLPERLAILNGLMSLLQQHQEELALEAAREGGKPLMDSRIEAARAVDSIRVCIETMRTDYGHGIPMNLNAASKNRLAVTRFEPIGPVLALSAFNHPLNLIAHQVGPAIAAGCPCIVKPAEATPLSCIRFVRMLYEAGLPEEWCQCVIAENLDVVQKMVADPRVAFVSFIGSARVGWMLRSTLAPGTRVALEHGGVAPVIVSSDASLEEAVPMIAKGGFYHAGQVCVSVQRVFVHESIAHSFAEKLAERAKKMKIGDPTLPETEIGPLIRKSEVGRVDEWIKEAVQGGAELLCGGKKISDSCYEATVLYNPPAQARVTREEVFGPVVCVYPFADLDEAIARANDSPFAFQSAVFTKNLDTALRCYARLKSSAVMVNDHTAFRVDWMPFAGLEQSGHGVGGIPYTIRDMQIEKMLVIHSPGLA